MNNYNFKKFIIAIAIFNYSILHVLAELDYKIYNAAKNKCIRANGPDYPITYGICDGDSASWILPNNNFNGYELQYRSRAYPDYCISADEDGIVSLKECNENTTVNGYVNYLIANKQCFGSSESNPNEIALKQCSNEDPEQIWYFYYNFQYVQVYFYNAAKNKCLRFNGYDAPLTYGTCDNSENTVWYIPFTHEGYYSPKIDPSYCLSIENGKISLKECSDKTILYRDGNFIKSPSSDNYCIGSSEKNPKEIAINECDIDDQDQIWYFNNYDPVLVVQEFPEQPETVTVYFYNAISDTCIRVYKDSIINYVCDLTSDDSLWEIPVSHHGYYRSKSNPEKCLGIVNGVVALSECNENSILYRDGNLIKSTLPGDYCIVPSRTSYTLEYAKSCDENDYLNLWYFNFITDPTEEEPTVTEIGIDIPPTEIAELPIETPLAPAEVFIPDETIRTEIPIPVENPDIPKEITADPSEFAAIVSEMTAGQNAQNGNTTGTNENTVISNEIAAGPSEIAAFTNENTGATNNENGATQNGFGAAQNGNYSPQNIFAAPTPAVKENPTMTVTTVVTAVVTGVNY